MKTPTPKNLARLERNHLKKVERHKERVKQKLLKCMSGTVTPHIYCAQFVLDTKKHDQTELQRLMEVVCEYDIDLNDLGTMAHRARFPDSTPYNKHPEQLDYWLQLLSKLEEDPICKEVLGTL